MLKVHSYKNYNIDGMAEHIGVSSDQLKRLLNFFKSEATIMIEQLKASLKTKDYEKATSFAHSLKGASMNMQLIEISDMAKKIEDACASSSESFAYSDYIETIEKSIATIEV